MKLMKLVDFQNRKQALLRQDEAGCAVAQSQKPARNRNVNDRKSHTKALLEAILSALAAWQGRRRFNAERARLYWHAPDSVLQDLGISRTDLQTLRPPSEPELVSEHRR
jgi:uncharacterized protein YjiS (DUF1127 family)